ncbi:MAG: SulP family inorganic anion transporter, partial [Pyrinomonadaceae bacterium]|nr:SulP family inorganic anion transporter [Pyrinomonadaceae bacterium]
YSCILPAVAYAIFGSSRQLVVNPDAAACAIVAATVAPLAAVNTARYEDLSIILTFLTGLFCIVGGIAGLGVIANFLSRPILTGYLNGIALSIIAGQLGTLLGFRVTSGGFFRTVAEAVSRISETHVATLTVGLSLFVLLLALKRLTPKLPGPLIAAAIGCGAVYALALPQQGVSVVGAVPSGFPTPHVPSVATTDLWPLIFGAGGIMLVSFCSMMTTARGFAAKNGYGIDVNQDMFALGVSDLASGLTRGFVVSGADSRTAVADSAGGKTQVASVVAAAAMAAVLLFLTKPLAYLPTAALAAILVSSALGLFDVASLRRYYRVSPVEFRHSIVAMLGVMTIGVLPGVLIAVGLALLNLLRLASRPHDAVLRAVTGEDGVPCAAKKEDGGKVIPGMIIYRFDSSLLFFNADYFKDRVRTVIEQEDPKPRAFLFDAEAVPLVDVTGADALEALCAELEKQGIALEVARAHGLFRLVLERTGVAGKIGEEHIFPTVHAGIQHFLEASSRGANKKEEVRI